VQAPPFCLVKGIPHYPGVNAGNFNIHLKAGYAVLGTCHFKIHIPKVVFLAQDVREDGVTSARRVAFGYQPHGNTRHRLFHGHAGVQH